MERNDQQTHKGALPFEVERGYAAVPTAVMKHYFYHPKFNGSALMVYTYLLAHHNASEGYAWPTQIQASRDLGVSDKTFREKVKLLEQLRLVDVKFNDRYGSNNYYFRKPIEDRDEFFAEFPDAAERYRKHTESNDGIKRKRDVAKAEIQRKQAKAKPVDDFDVSEYSDWI